MGHFGLAHYVAWGGGWGEWEKTGAGDEDN